MLSDSAFFLRGLVVLSPERSYALELGPGDLQGPLLVSRTQDLLLPGHTCAPSWHTPVPTQAGPDLLLGQQHIHRVRRLGSSPGLTRSPVHGDSSAVLLCWSQRPRKAEAARSSLSSDEETAWLGDLPEAIH